MIDTGGGIRYRRLRHSDLPVYGHLIRLAVGRLEQATGLDQGVDGLARTLGRWPVWAGLRFLELIGKPFLQVTVAETRSRLVATGALVRLRNAGYVMGMATEPEYRGRGIASQILGGLTDTAARYHRPWTALDVESENATAIRVYRRAGYREVARFTWYRRPGAPTPAGGRPASDSLLPRRELATFATELDAGRNAEYRSALPATPRMLSHNELIIQGGALEHRTWLRRDAAGSPFALRAYFIPATRMGVFFPLTTGVDPSPEAVAPVLDEGSRWVGEHGVVTCLAVLPEPVGTLGAALERVGFTAVVSSVTMVEPVRAEPAVSGRPA